MLGQGPADDWSDDVLPATTKVLFPFDEIDGDLDMATKSTESDSVSEEGGINDLSSSSKSVDSVVEEEDRQTVFLRSPADNPKTQQHDLQLDAVAKTVPPLGPGRERSTYFISRDANTVNNLPTKYRVANDEISLITSLSYDSAGRARRKEEPLSCDDDIGDADCCNQFIVFDFTPEAAQSLLCNCSPHPSERHTKSESPNEWTTSCWNAYDVLCGDTLLLFC